MLYSHRLTPRCALVVALLFTLSSVTHLAGSARAQDSHCAPLLLGDTSTFYDGGGADFDAALFSDGSGIVVWAGRGFGIGDDSRQAVLARRVDAAGNPAGERFVVNTLTDQDQFRSKVAASPDGRFVVVWESDTSPGDGERSSIRGRVFAANGTPLGPDFRVNSSTSGSQVAPDVAMAENGDFVVVFYDDSDGPGSSDKRGREVRARRYLADGTPLGTDFIVNELTDGTENEPAVAMAPDGSFVVTWKSTVSPGNDNGDASIQARMFDAGGSASSAQFQVNDTTQGSQSEPAIAMDPDRSFLIVWRSPSSEESDQDGGSIHARGYFKSGAAVSPQRQVNERTVNHQWTPEVAAAGGREFLVVWHSDELPIDPSVQARAVTLEGEFLGTERFIANIANSHPNPGVGGNGAGRTIVIFNQINAVNAQVFDLPCADQGSPSDCTEEPTNLCLADDRFRITTFWRDTQGKSGIGQAVELTGDTGYFWFFNSANVETVVKVLDACGFNNRFWVFIGGLTNLNIEFAIEDTDSGVIRRYENPQGAAFLTINDTSAFDTCP